MPRTPGAQPRQSARKLSAERVGKRTGHVHSHSRVLYLKVEGLNGLPILVIGELAKKCPLVLQVFVKPLKREQAMEEKSCT